LRLRDFLDPEVVEPLGHGLPPSGLGEAILIQATRICAQRDREQTQEAAEGKALYERLMALEAKERPEALRTNPEFVSQGLARVLLETGEEATDPNVSHHLGLLALTLLDQLKLPALSVLGLCLVAEAQRRKGEVEAAGEILKSACLEVESEPVSSPVRARLCRGLASVRKDEDRLDEALALLARACALFEEQGEFAELAEARLEEGLIFLEELEHERALAALRAALPLVDPAADPRLAVAVLHALAFTCAELGRSESLREVLEALDALRKLLPERLDGLRIRWIRAQVEWRLGNLKSAVERLQRVLAALLEGGGPAAETATAALELARMHADKHPASPPSAYRDLLLALEPLAREGRLSAPLWEVCSFALGFAQKGKGFIAEVFDRAIRHLQVAQFNPELPFYPLSDPKEVVSWQELAEGARQAAALAAGVELVRGEPGSPAARRLLAWTEEALSGVRLQFPDLGLEERRLQ
jgi:tetratricopeptide (TPR) repeat protein